MYQIEWPRIAARSRLAVAPTVWALGFTSLFTDISSEMVSSVLPAYLVLHLRLSPLQFGFIDGLYQGVTALLRLASGVIADRWRRHKEVAAAGYGLSAVCKLGLLAAGSAWAWVAAVIALDRTGKGLRTAPRDALITLSTARDRLGAAFGVHRALDAAGAMLGPLVAFLILVQLANAFDVVFVTSFSIAIVGLGVLMVFVENAARRQPAPARAIALGDALRLANDAPFRRLIIAGGLLALATISDGFIYLGLQQRMGLDISVFPLLAVGTALAYVLLAVPMGRLADRLGRPRVFIAGYVLLAIVYATLFAPAGGFLIIIFTVVLLGAYYAATDGVLMAAAGAMLPAGLCATGLAALTTVTSLARLLSSVLFGWAWTRWGIDAAVGAFLVALIAELCFVASFSFSRWSASSPR